MLDLHAAVKLHLSNATSSKKTPATWKHEQQGGESTAEIGRGVTVKHHFPKEDGGRGLHIPQLPLPIKCSQLQSTQGSHVRQQVEFN